MKVFAVYVEAIANISNGSDDGFEFSTKFGTEAPDMNIYGTSATEIVIAPNLMK